MKRGPLPLAVEGNGCFLREKRERRPGGAQCCTLRGSHILACAGDADGKRYLDGSGGAAVSCLGHSDKYVIEAIRAQLDQLPYAHTSMFTSAPAEALATALATAAPAGIEHVYFVSGGSESVEAALKVARQYYVEIGESSREHIISREGSYHGNTLGALATGGNAMRREKFLPLLRPTSHIPACYAYRLQHEGESEDEYSRRAAGALEEEILRLGPENVMAFICEPVVGATLGAVPPTPGYLRAIREICTRYGVLLVFDEVMCGMGRCGTLFACEYDNVQPDIVCVAKGLGAGYVSIGAMLCSADIYNAIDRGSGSFVHGHTYQVCICNEWRRMIVR